MSDDPLLDYLERTFADSYRKEVDQEENVWRSLPFFAATLALQLAALAQVRDWLAGQAGGFLLASEILLVATAAATISALVLLAMSVWPADLRRVSPEPDFLKHAERTRTDMRHEAAGADEEEIAQLVLRKLKREQAEQYADATGHNRVVNRRRTKWRTGAGLATLGSVLAMLALVALVVLSNVHAHG